eukprot:12135707-Alexandrium_andersonii.AAC.1
MAQQPPAHQARPQAGTAGLPHHDKTHPCSKAVRERTSDELSKALLARTRMACFDGQIARPASALR